MVHRGRAVVVKKSKYKDVWVDKDGDEVSPPRAFEREKENFRKPKQSQKLSSEAPKNGRQDSQSPEQSAARREALAHLFDDDNKSAQDQDRTILSVEPRAPQPLPSYSGLLDSVTLPLRQVEATLRRSENKSNPLAEELAGTPKPIPEEILGAQRPSPIAHRNSSSPASNASSVEPNETPVEPNEQPEATDDMANANNFIPTNQMRNMRACMVCSVVKTEQQFRQQGCPNCDGFLQLRGNPEGIQDCTSQVFEGLITVSDTSKSWVARWQRLEGYVPGVYAVQVEGILPEEMITAAEENGVHYIPRDGSVNEALPTDA